MKQMLRRMMARLVRQLLRSPRIKLLGQRILAHFPRLRGLVLRLMHGGPLFQGDEPIANTFDARGENQQRLLEELERRWERQP